jgi:hypothetical protein
MSKSMSYRSVTFTLLLIGSLTFSCQENSSQSDAKKDSAVAQGADTSYNGLEGTRDEAASILSTDVKADTTSGKNVVKDQHSSGKLDSTKK